MEMRGKVTGAEINGGVLQVTLDVSEYKDGALIESRTAQVDLPLKYASAYYVGRSIKVVVSPLEET